MKKIILVAAGTLLSLGLVAYAATSEGNEPEECCKKACPKTECVKSGCDSLSTAGNCNPAACRPGK